MIEKFESKAMLCPILEDDVLMCSHGGKVQLKSIKGKPFKNNGVSLILEPDLMYAPISGCSYNILGIPTPCTMVAVIPPSALSIKKFNGEKAVMQDYVSMIMTDKGFPLQIIPKVNKWKLSVSVPQNTYNECKNKEYDKESIKHIFHIRYCLSEYYNNILDGTYDVLIYNSSIENIDADVKSISFHNIKFNKPIRIMFEYANKSDDKIYSLILNYLKENYIDKIYSYKAIAIDIGNNIFEYIFISPKNRKSESTFGFLSTGIKFIRIDNNRKNSSHKPIITEIIKASFVLEYLDLVIS